MCYADITPRTAYKGQVQLAAAGGNSMTSTKSLSFFTSPDDGAPEWGYVCIPEQFQNTTLHTLAGTVCRQLGFTNYSDARVTNGYKYIDSSHNQKILQN